MLHPSPIRTAGPNYPDFDMAFLVWHDAHQDGDPRARSLKYEVVIAAFGKAIHDLHTFDRYRWHQILDAALRGNARLSHVSFAERHLSYVTPDRADAAILWNLCFDVDRTEGSHILRFRDTLALG